MCVDCNRLPFPNPAYDTEVHGDVVIPRTLKWLSHQPDWELNTIALSTFRREEGADKNDPLSLKLMELWTYDKTNSENPLEHSITMVPEIPPMTDFSCQVVSLPSEPHRTTQSFDSA
jgi:hypothetical protein